MASAVMPPGRLRCRCRIFRWVFSIFMSGAIRRPRSAMSRRVPTRIRSSRRAAMRPKMRENACRFIRGRTSSSSRRPLTIRRRACRKKATDRRMCRPRRRKSRMRVTPFRPSRWTRPIAGMCLPTTVAVSPTRRRSIFVCVRAGVARSPFKSCPKPTRPVPLRFPTKPSGLRCLRTSAVTNRRFGICWRASRRTRSILW